MEKRGKKAQILGMPYSVLFSIILIIFFFVAAWIAITLFWHPGCKCALSDSAQEGLFKDDLKTAIDDVWASAGGDKPFPIKLPDKIKYVCFYDYNKPAAGNFASFESEFKQIGNGNVYFQPTRCACKGFKFYTLNHINMSETTKTSNPVCIGNNQELWIKSDFGGIVKIYKKS